MGGHLSDDAATYGEVLRGNRNFRMLWLGTTISLFGDWFNTIVLATLIASYALDESQGIAISGLLLARTLSFTDPVTGQARDFASRLQLRALASLG